MRRRRVVPPAVATVLLLCAVAALTPGTSGGLSASIRSGTAAARASYGRWFTCAEEVAQPAVRMLAALPLDDPTGSTSARDLSDAGVDAEYSAASTTDTDQPPACLHDQGGAWAPDGSTVLAITGIAAADACTVELWLRTTDRAEIVLNGVQRRVRPIRGGRSLSWALATDDAGGLVLGWAGAEVLRTPPGTRVDDGRWHHLALVISGGGTALLLDGRPAASSESTLPNSIPQLRVAGGDAAALPRELAGAGAFRGALRYLLVEDGALDAPTIREHVAAGRLRS